MMASNCDLQILPVSRMGGQEQPGLPGVFIASPPRRTVRVRRNDYLLLYMDLFGGQPVSEDQQKQILQKLSRTYFSTSGSVSSTLRSNAEDYNDILLALNREGSGSGIKITGSLTQIVVRGDSIYTALSGPLHVSFVSESGTEYLYDLSLTGQGLGLGKATPVRFYQAQLNPSDFLLIASKPSPRWDLDQVSGFQGQEPEGIRQSLFKNEGSDLSALLIFATQGQGQVLHIPWQVANAAVPTIDSGNISETGSSLQAEQKPAQPIEANETAEIPGEQEVQSGQDRESTILEKQPEMPADKPGTDQIAGTPMAKVERPRKPVLPAMVAVSDAFGHFFDTIGAFLGNFLGRLFPEELLQISSLTMAMVAIIVPLVVVAVGSLAYYQLGRADQGRRFYLLAGEVASEALNLEQPLSKRSELLVALDYLDQAEDYGGVPSAQLNELRLRLYDEIDRLDIVRRIDYRPALVTDLPEGVKIIRMLVSFNDLYLLDSNSGSVFRAFETPLGYEIDDDFRCSPEFASPPVNPLIDMVLWQGFDPEANIMAVDSIGNILFCHPGKDPVRRSLVPSPTGNFQSITAIASDRGALYVLDSPANSVWVYPFGQLEDPPSFFFGETPPPIQDTVDLTANFDELYLLHSDGRLTLCFAFAQDISLPKCNDPQPYTDFREGRENTPFIPPRPFTQLYGNPAPDPSLYFLEPTSQSVTHFSFRNLGYLQEFSPLNPLPGGDASAFTISGVERLLFIALGNRVYNGVMP